MDKLNLPKPKLIDEAVPANRFCGLEENQRQDTIVHREVAREQAKHWNAPIVNCNGDLPKTGRITVQDMVSDAKQQITEINVEKSKQLNAGGNITI